MTVTHDVNGEHMAIDQELVTWKKLPPSIQISAKTYQISIAN